MPDGTGGRRRGSSECGGSGRSCADRRRDHRRGGQEFPIVDLELAWAVDRADEVVSQEATETIRAAIAWNFLPIALHSLAISTGTVWARRQFTSRLGKGAATAVAMAGVAAGALDPTENPVMLRYLDGWMSWIGWIRLAATMAVPKLSLALVGVLYIPARLARFVVRRIRR